MARRVTAGAIGLFLGSAGLVALVPASPPAGALGPAPTIRQFAGAPPTPWRVPDSVVKVGDALYITDEHGIDRVDLVTDDVVVWAGDRITPGSKNGTLGEARFNDPSGLATDGQNLYLADAGNHTIRKIELATQRVSTIAGTPGAGGAVDAVGWGARFNRPKAVALSTDGARLFVADAGNHTIRAVDLASRAVTTLAGTAGQPGTTDGIGAAARFTSPRALAADGGVLWIGEGARVRRLDLGTGQTTRLIEFWYYFDNTVTGIATGDTHLSVANTYDDHDGSTHTELTQVDKVTGGLRYLNSSVLESTGVFREGQTLFVAGSGLYGTEADVFDYDLTTDTLTRIGDYGDWYTRRVGGVGPAAQFGQPALLGTDGTNLYVLGEGAVYKVAPTGAVTVLLANFYVCDLASDGAYLYGCNGNTVQRLELATGQITTLATIGTSGYIWGLARAGNALFMSYNCAIYRYDLVTSNLRVHSGQPGACANVDGSSTAARYNFPREMGAYGNDLFVNDSIGNSRSIRRVKVDSGAASTIVDSARGLYSPLGDLSSDGTYVYTTQTPFYANDIVKVNIATGALTVLTGWPTCAAPPCSQRPLTYTPRPASLTVAGASLGPDNGYVSGVEVLNGGHQVYFINETGVGVITDAKVPAQLGVGDVGVVEGDAGTGVANFTVRLSSPQPTTVTVNYTTADNVAIAGSDYVAAAGSLAFPPGVVEKQVQVSVNGDADDEADEVFTLKLSAPSGAVLARPKGKATILDDDPGGGVALSVGDAKIVEGDDLTARAVFTVRLSSPQPGPVTVNFATADGSAAAGGDYQARLGTATFAAGQTSKNVFVTVNGDYAVEAQETFTLTISGSSGPPITRASGTGRISPDD